MEAEDIFTIITADNNRKQYLPLLLMGDESESMIDRYLDSGTLYVGLLNGKPIAVCIAVNLDSDTVEIKISLSKPNTDDKDTVVECLNMSNLNTQIKRSSLVQERHLQR